MVIQNVVRHAVAVEDGNQHRQDNHQKDDEQRAGCGVERIQCAFIQGNAATAQQAAAGDGGRDGIHKAVGEGAQHKQEGSQIAGGQGESHQDRGQQQLQTQQGPEALISGLQSIAGGILSPGDTDHAAHVAEAHAYAHNGGQNGQKAGYGGQEAPAAHTGESSRLGDAAGQQELNQCAQTADTQSNGSVE